MKDELMRFIDQRIKKLNQSCIIAAVGLFLYVVFFILICFVPLHGYGFIDAKQKIYEKIATMKLEVENLQPKTALERNLIEMNKCYLEGMWMLTEKGIWFGSVMLFVIGYVILFIFFALRGQVKLLQKIKDIEHQG